MTLPYVHVLLKLGAEQLRLQKPCIQSHAAQAHWSGQLHAVSRFAARIKLLFNLARMSLAKMEPAQNNTRLTPKRYLNLALNIPENQLLTKETKKVVDVGIL